MINLSPQEFDENMDWLANISDKPGPGTTRQLYTKSWVKAVNSMKERFEDLGMTVELDEVGNLFATLEGTEEPDAIIATGSHIDTVENGGRLDGQLGVMAGYLAVKKLLEEEGKPKKSLRVIAFAEEEGSRFPTVFWGSRNVLGLNDDNEVKDLVDQDGINFVDAMHEAGFDFRKTEPRFNKMDAFLELHIEQGNLLEMEGQQVGVVTAITGQKRWNITLKGEANHAGTTYMGYRKDTVECMSRIVVSSIDKAKKIGDPLVLTFGSVNVIPNSVNVVPGENMFTMDCRNVNGEVLNDFTAEIEADMRRIAAEMNIEIDIEKWMNEEPVPMDEDIVNMLEAICEENDMSYRVMPSGAGHDSQLMAKHVPTAMLFVPSIGGISHNPKEHTKAEDCVEGIKVLAEGLRRLAY